jgi:hypothetical protein
VVTLRGCKRDGNKFFFEKKNQKTFAPLRGALKTPGSPEQKSFCGAFFKKRPLA